MSIATGVARALLLKRFELHCTRWNELREQYAFADEDNRDWSKGNARWANGARLETERIGLDGATPSSFLDEVTHLLRTRGWDHDYSEPKNARSEMLDVAEQVRALFVRPRDDYDRARLAPELRFFRNCVELALHPIVDNALGAPLVDEPVQSLVTVQGGAVWHSSNSGSAKLEIDVVDAEVLCWLAGAAIARRIKSAGVHPTADYQDTANVRITLYDCMKNEVSAAMLSASFRGEPELSFEWWLLLSFVLELIRPGLAGAVPPVWTALADRFSLQRGTTSP